MKFLIAGFDYIDRLQSRSLCNTAQSFLPFIRIPNVILPVEESTRLRRSLVCQMICSTQLINIHHLADHSPEIANQKIIGRCISLMPGVQ